ncbi:peptide chain release factor N(5)-glutamine methyltransferase [Oceanobacillus luteolus]|nr:peptide chain release factor N(5)-glutamine methyltransferase [Oceanobacillus luteolus]MCM3741469.1 peptide chain release factor N(5)-glutamine methyltransferase [Oceanobacillus luteolus]
MMKKQYEVLRWASVFLEENNRESRVAELLLQHHLGVTRSQFFMNMQEHIPVEVYEAFKADIEKHATTGIPLQHLTGYEEFYGRRFSVNEHVLIPRPETEELVQHVIQAVDKVPNQNLRLVDVGTGSGVIAITLALELPNVEVLATDISPEALQVAKANAASLQANVTFHQGDFLEPLNYQQKTVDIIVSNPPYIAESEREELSDTVKLYDPDLALFAEDDGLAAYKKIIKQAKSVLKEDSLIALEIGYTQGEAVKKLLLDSFPQSEVKLIQDINGKNRIIIAKL